MCVRVFLIHPQDMKVEKSVTLLPGLQPVISAMQGGVERNKGGDSLIP